MPKHPIEKPMQAACTACGATYQLAESAIGRKARCKKCGETFVVEAPQAEPPPLPRTSRESTGSTRREREDEGGADSGPWPVIALAVLVFLAAAGQAWQALGETGALAADSDVPGDPDFRITGIHGLTALAFIAIGVGMLRGKTWAWWCGLLLHGGSLALNAKFAYYWLSRLNWDHERAAGIARGVAMRNGVPIAIAAVSLVFLFLPRVRIFFGMKDKPRPVRHKRIRPS